MVIIYKNLCLNLLGIYFISDLKKEGVVLIFQLNSRNNSKEHNSNYVISKKLGEVVRYPQIRVNDRIPFLD